MNWKQLLSPKRFGDKQEAAVADNSRSRFEQDYDRLIFSHPFRKLQDKTQVFPLPEDDFVHTRLTHSLEVSSVGRSLGKAVGEKIIDKYPELKEAGYTFHDFGGIVAAASLAHDLGNPPFGHSGETAISSFFTDHPAGKAFEQRVAPNQWSDLVSFEGNAQGFRILNDPANGGLRLTFAALGAFTKYPKSSSAPQEKSRKSQKKHGFYHSNLPEFTEVAENMGLQSIGEEAWCRHPLTFLVEAADDICYNIIDLEDGCRLGLVPYETTRDLLAAIIGESYNEEKLERSSDMNQKLGLLRALAIGRLINETVALFLEKEEAILNGLFDGALTEHIPCAEALGKISELSIAKIYRSKQVLEREAGGFEVIGKLMEAFCMASYCKLFDTDNYTPRKKSIYRLLPVGYQEKLTGAESVYESLLVVMDFISSLTDSHAIKLYKTIYGFSLPTGGF
ncbi:deoxyguanosinetriphosphate triphosphohydrolase [Marinoscillum furvescens]|uniref:dGTPase n=1 Tax=Marinoscillum furvescens DSM 4134 TaxID=1122208 RepID=A0A3D9KWN3_MARFU|nr:deoxyguanosinetriphosphate triphosphohydrolase [Marinoscillum furvescens]RED91633.1 dGTPase [Marinoscillum furvescens DSM 4134]